MKIRPVGAKSFDADEHTDGLTDGRTDTDTDKHRSYTLCVQTVRLFNVKLAVHIETTELYRVKIL